jgi:hypothetical protein
LNACSSLDMVRMLKGANIRVAPLPGVAWEDRRHGFRVPLPRR